MLQNQSDSHDLSSDIFMSSCLDKGMCIRVDIFFQHLFIG